MSKTSLLMTAIAALPLALGSMASAQTTAKIPNIVVIMADDVGIWNISAYHRIAKWPGIIKPGIIVNDIIAGEDFLPTFLAAAGEPDIKGKLLNGLKVGDKTFKTHLDGYDFLPYLKGEVGEGPRKEFFYFTDNGDLTAVRYADWKLSFKTIKGNLFTGTEESTNVPLATNLRQDPWEKYPDESMMYARWWGEKL
jgi:arylsulfatase A-like enzyme